MSRWHLGNAQRGLHQREPGVLVTDAVADAGVSKVAPTVSTHPSGADDAPVLAGGIHTGAMVVAGLISAGFDPGWVVDSFTRVPARTIRVRSTGHPRGGQMGRSGALDFGLGRRVNLDRR